MNIQEKLKIGRLGCHASGTGGVWRALLEGASIGATTIQLFTANQRRWENAPLSEEAIRCFRKVKEATGLTELMSHASYLLNLGSPNEGNLAKSRKAFKEEIKRCSALGIAYVNFHPGAALGGTQEACLDRIVESILEMKPLLRDSKVRLLLEMTAGQGSTIGKSFEEIKYILERTSQKVPVGVCIDTCHIFAAGYDIRTPSTWKATLDEFDSVVGSKHLFAFHLNDSLHPLGSHKDRHAPLGKGLIGIDAFRYLMASPQTWHLPKYLETPGGTELWKKEINLLRSYATATV